MTSERGHIFRVSGHCFHFFHLFHTFHTFQTIRPFSPTLRRKDAKIFFSLRINRIKLMASALFSPHAKARSREVFILRVENTRTCANRGKCVQTKNVETQNLASQGPTLLCRLTGDARFCVSTGLSTTTRPFGPTPRREAAKIFFKSTN